MLEPYETHNALALDRVIAISQKRSSSGLTVALTAMEVYGHVGGLLRYLISKDVEEDPDLAGFLPIGLIATAKDRAGRPYEIFDRGGPSAVKGSTEGALEVPIGGAAEELTVTVTAVVGLEVGPIRRGGGLTREGSWAFHFSVVS